MPSINGKDLWGKNIMQCGDDAGFMAPSAVTQAELRSFPSFLVEICFGYPSLAEKTRLTMLAVAEDNLSWF
jgi:hypothetical protein